MVYTQNKTVCVGQFMLFLNCLLQFVVQIMLYNDKIIELIIKNTHVLQSA